MRPWLLMCPIVVIGYGSVPPMAAGQARVLSRVELTRIFLSGGDVAGWDEYQVPQFVAEYYGPRATSAIVEILQLRTTREDFYLQLEAITAAGYAKLGVPSDLLLPFARGERGRQLPSALAEIIQQRATLSLTGHPDASLVPFWDEVARNGDPMIRQHAALGLACALGTTAEARIVQGSTDSDRVVREVAERARVRLREEGGRARVCFGLARDSARALPNQVSPALLAAARRYLGELPQ